VPLTKLVDRGLVKPVRGAPGWGLTPDEIPLGHNLQLDNFRQYMAYAMTFRGPIGNYVLQRFGVGTGVTPPTVGDVQLQNAIQLVAPDNPNVGTKLIDYVAYPAPFYAYIYFTLGVNDANGYSVTELGLYSGDNTLLIRWTVPGINKDATYSPQLVHRLAW
jgi:hypothetical protein